MPIAGYLLEWFGWRWMFIAFGLLGVIWAIAFYAWFRDDPATHPAVNSAEREWIGESRAVPVSRHDPIPWGMVGRNASIWALCGTMICGAFNSYFYFSWFPSYLEQARQVANLQSSWHTSTLYLGGALGMLCGGLVAGRSIRSAVHRDLAIRIQGGLAFAAASICLWLAAHSDHVWTMVLLTALSYGSSQSAQPLFWSCTINISGRHIGSIFGLINMSGMLGAAASQYFVGAYIGGREALGFKGRELWDPVFIVYELMLLVGGVCWSLYRTRLVEPDASIEETALSESRNPERETLQTKRPSA
jgi:sugar phosphate permease